MVIGRGEDERSLAKERGGSPHRVTLDIEREDVDDYGPFYVAFVRHAGRSRWDFTTFGSRKRDEADALAREFIKTRRFELVDELE